MKNLLISFSLSLLALALSQSYNCTSTGRFRYEDPTCRSYYLCELYDGAYVKSNYTCPSTMIFNPTNQTCDPTGSAVCIDDACDDLPETPANPKIPDPNGPNCQTYIECVSTGGTNSSRYPVVETCPDGLLFDQSLTPEADCGSQGNCTTS